MSEIGYDCTYGGKCPTCVYEECEQLRATVGEMEKTADGVLVVRGMKVYQFDPVGYLQSYDVGGHSAMDDSSMPSPAYLIFNHSCYSTPEVARAAAEAAKGNK